MYRRLLIVTTLTVLVVSGMVSTLPDPVAAQGDPLAPCAEALANYTPVVGTDRYPTPTEMPLPAPREAFVDPTFGTCIVRVTDRLTDFDVPQIGLKNEYSRVQSFNADESLVMVYGTESNDWFLYDAQTLAPLQVLRLGISFDEPRWDARHPNRITFSPWSDAEEPTYMRADLAPGEEGFEANTFARVFTADLPPEWNTAVLWRRWEGSPSNDSRYDAFMAEDEEFITRGLVSYDWQNDAILGLYSVTTDELYELDNVGMSPSGDYVMAQFDCCPEGQLGTYDTPCGAMTYTRDLSDGWGISRCMGHSDMTFDTQGREVIVHQETTTDQIVMTTLDTGETTPLLALDFSGGVYGMHISGRAFDHPGWVAVSIHPEDEAPDFSNPFWMVGTIFALELAPNPRVVQLAHHHTLRDESAEEGGYFAEAHVSVNRDFTRLLFTSNWEETYGANEVEMYMIALPDDWIERLP